MPTLKPRNLGTFVHPRLPFPFLDFPAPPTDLVTSPAPVPAVEKETRELHATILIPSVFIPTEKPRRPRIWGGALVPSFSPLFATPQLITHLQSGLSYGFMRPHPYEIYGMRRVYTDDSDMFLCALHAGWITWSMARKAHKEGKDLRLEVRLSRESRYPGGLGSKFMGPTDGKNVQSGDDGSTLLSAGWGNNHDGAGVEIMRAEFVKPGTARKMGLRNRVQRILEYSERASALGCMSPLRKRRRVDPVSDEDLEEYTMALASDADVCAARTVVLGYRKGLQKVGFKYDSGVVKSTLFSVDERPRKKAKLSDSNALQMDVDCESATASVEPALTKRPSIIIETIAETFLIHPQDGFYSIEDKENATSAADDSLKYTISLVHISEPLPTSPKDAVASELASDKAATTKSSAQLQHPQQSEISRASSSGTKDSTASRPTATESKDAEVAAQEPKGGPSESRQTSVPLSSPAAIAAPSSEPSKATEDDSKVGSEVAGVLQVGGVPASDLSAGSNKVAPAETKANSTESKLPEARIDEPAKEQSAAVEEVPMTEASEIVPPSTEPKSVVTLEVLQRNVGQADLHFDADGISILSSQVDNGMRKGWKIEARTWRWATEELTAIAS
ncbi:uncharacterized protein PHACADRAFT_264097 [Phanerochaete carnosa HHB-10118-sp]|uniref:Uncharacterized protein n=1 Tax=Phanerochaete carnosa (strain HHB-10118-sp) TaxID=650164 RepID=K5VV52_PHACS|nr:uncharacterized protein PHACADRAFT_264097 [Phanerochaete carnosa HHB-10118-sp]EKM50690.1 hypothetical protein PHACADRAFT_264097 [Phanerochaete carnosa HHB-10118-sp]